MNRWKIFLIVLFVGSWLGQGCSSKRKAEVENAELAGNLVTISGIDVADLGGDAELNIRGSGEPKYNVFKLSDPDKVVIDLIDARLESGVPTSMPGVGSVQEVKVSSLEDSLSSVVRVELMLASAANYVANVEGGSLKVRVLSGAAAMPMADAAAPVPDSAVAPIAPDVPSPAPSTDLPSISTGSPTVGTDLSPMAEAPAPAPLPEVAPEPMPAPAVDLAPAVPAPVPDLTVPQVAEAPTPAPLPEVAPEPAPAPTPVPEVAMPADAAESNFPTPVPLPQRNSKKERDQNSKIVKGVDSQDIPSAGLTEGTSLLTELDSKVYTGKRVSLEFQDADIQDVLRLLADVSRLNIVTGDDVKGKVTVKLIDVPWDQALDIILTTLGLDKVQHGNILRVAPVEKLKKEREVALANDKAAKQLEPLRLKLINVNYATADEMKDRLKNLLSERGTIDTDSRTNTLIVKDIREHISRVENLIKALDTQTPQVRIESRIVQANDQFNRSLGIQWGPTMHLDQTNGKSRGITFPRDITFTGQPDSAPVSSSFAVDALPTSSGSSLGLRVGSINDIFNLDLRLQYAETESLARVVSRPSVTVLDNRSAKIIQGTKIPFLSSSSDGSNVQFQEAGIEISVTPQITSDGAVIMKVATKSDEPGGQSVGGNLSILIRQAQTEMLVKSGQTAVLGGVFRESETKGKSGVPYLMDIPVLGWLFKGTARGTQREETLIFITPYILNDLRTAATTPQGASELEP